jgi:hypothetical protein
LTRALERLEDGLLDAPIVEAVIARREAGARRPADERNAAALTHELCRFQDADGSWGGSLVRTAEALLLMHALTPDPDDRVRAGVSRAGEWIRTREGIEGAFGEGCDPARHSAGLCSHVLAGFFSPAPASADLTGLTLAVPARFGSDADARLGASCVALLALLHWGFSGADIEVHLASLRQLVSGDSLGGLPDGSAGGFVAAVTALLAAPPDDARAAAVRAGIARLLRMQRADGSWPGADTFHVLDLLLRASAQGLGGDAVDGAIQRAVEMLALLQRADGSWGRETGSERMLVGWRALRHAVGLRAGAAGAVRDAAAASRSP